MNIFDKLMDGTNWSLFGETNVGTFLSERFVEVYLRNNTRLHGTHFNVKKETITSNIIEDIYSYIEKKYSGKYKGLCSGDSSKSSQIFSDDFFVSIYKHGENYNVSAQGTKEFIEDFSKFFNRFGKLPSVSYHYMNNGRIETKLVYLADKQPAPDEHYPYLKKGVAAYLDGFIKDRSMILMLQGPPGTGKTSLIRHFITKNNLKAKVTFDEQVMKSDKFFLDFITDDDEDVLVIEDADEIILSRESFANKVVSKILNFADGVAQVKNKKIIFSTNLDNASKIDQAILRPGRCYEYTEFRKLTMDEANVIRKNHGMKPYTKESYYSIAEIFNDKNDVVFTGKFGF